MYNFIKKLPVILCLFLVTGCSGKVQMETIDKSYSTETVMVDAKIPQISGLSSENFQDTINSEYEKTVTTLLNEFEKQAEQTGDVSTFTVTTTEHHNSGGFLSAVTQIDSCVQSAHKNSKRITNNIDTYRSSKISLSELFDGDSYIDMINSRIEAEVDGNSEKYAGLWEKPRLLEGQDYYITDDCLVLCYEPYKLSYFERGFVEIPLSLSDMSGYLKEEYRHLAGN